MNRKLSEQQKSEIIEKYLTGKYRCNELAIEYNIAKSAISAFLKRKNINVNNNLSEILRKYTLNINYFDTIDTEDKAYFLGLLYADGYNKETDGQVVITLQERDKQILEKFNFFLGHNKPLYFFNRNSKNSNWKNAYSLSFNNKYISKQLSKLGCFQCKSLTLKFPTEEQVPNHLMNHFIRGYIDGDGSILRTSTRYSIVCTFISTSYFCESFCTFIKGELDIDCKIRHDKRVPDKSTRELCIKGGQQKIIKFLDWLYKDSTIYLERKYKNYKC